MQRKMIGEKALDRVRHWVDLGAPIAVAVNMLGLKGMGDRTAFDLVKADLEDKEAVRPPWLKYQPDVQLAPDDWRLVGGLDGHWEEI